MDREYYTVGEIFLSFRDEYKRINAKLDELKQYVQVNDSNVNDFHFELTNNKLSVYPLLICRFDLKRNVLNDIKNKLSNIYVNLESSYRNFSLVKFDDYDEPFIASSYNTRIVDSDAFLDKLYSIYNSDFIKNVNSSINDDKSKLSIYFNYMWIKLQVNRENLYYFHSSDDLLGYIYGDLSGYSLYTQSSLLSEKLSMKIPSKILTSYQISVIEKSENSKKKIVFSNWSDEIISKKANYDLDDSSDDEKIFIKKIKN